MATASATPEASYDDNPQRVRRRAPLLLLAAGVLLIALVAAGIVGYRAASTSHALGPNPATVGASAPVKVGQRVWFGFTGFPERGHDRIRITGLHLLGVADGLVVTTTGSAHFGAKGYPIAVDDALMAQAFPDFAVQPVNAMTLVPGRDPASYLVIAAHATRPGTFLIRGIRLDYTVGWRHGSQSYQYQAEVDATA